MLILFTQEASSKLERAEKDRIIAEAKMKLWKTPTIGLARPVLPKYDPFITHRGEGAFCDKDFKKRSVGKEHLDEETKESGSEQTNNVSEKSGDKYTSENHVGIDEVENIRSENHVDADGVEKNKSEKTVDVDEVERVESKNQVKESEVEPTADDNGSSDDKLNDDVSNDVDKNIEIPEKPKRRGLSDSQNKALENHVTGDTSLETELRIVE